MRKLKGSGNYLKSQARKAFGKAFLCMFLFIVVLFSVFTSLRLNLSFGLFQELLLLISLAPFIASYFYFRRFRIYEGGLRGEKRVINLLNSTLSDDYYLINDLSLPSGGGDIDHIVFGPNGVFVIETKNWSGTIRCNGDVWQRENQRKFKGSPSKQVKKNSEKIKQVLGSSATLRNHGIWVQGLVVFTNRNADLQLKNPTTPVLSLNQLADFITTYKNYSPYTAQQLQQIAKIITKQAH